MSLNQAAFAPPPRTDFLRHVQDWLRFAAIATMMSQQPAVTPRAFSPVPAERPSMRRAQEQKVEGEILYQQHTVFREAIIVEDPYPHDPFHIKVRLDDWGVEGVYDLGEEFSVHRGAIPLHFNAGAKVRIRIEYTTKNGVPEKPKGPSTHAPFSVLMHRGLPPGALTRRFPPAPVDPDAEPIEPLFAEDDE